MRRLTRTQLLSLLFLSLLVILLPVVLISNQKQKQLLSKAQEAFLLLPATPSATIVPTVPLPSGIPTSPPTFSPTPWLTTIPTPPPLPTPRPTVLPTITKIPTSTISPTNTPSPIPTSPPIPTNPPPLPSPVPPTITPLPSSPPPLPTAIPTTIPILTSQPPPTLPPPSPYPTSVSLTSSPTPIVTQATTQGQGAVPTVGLSPTRVPTVTPYLIIPSPTPKQTPLGAVVDFLTNLFVPATVTPPPTTPPSAVIVSPSPSLVVSPPPVITPTPPQPPKTIIDQVIDLITNPLDTLFKGKETKPEQEPIPQGEKRTTPFELTLIPAHSPRFVPISPFIFSEHQTLKDFISDLIDRLMKKNQYEDISYTLSLNPDGLLNNRLALRITSSSSSSSFSSNDNTISRSLFLTNPQLTQLNTPYYFDRHGFFTNQQEAYDYYDDYPPNSHRLHKVEIINIQGGTTTNTSKLTLDQWDTLGLSQFKDAQAVPISQRLRLEEDKLKTYNPYFDGQTGKLTAQELITLIQWLNTQSSQPITVFDLNDITRLLITDDTVTLRIDEVRTEKDLKEKSSKHTFLNNVDVEGGFFEENHDARLLQQIETDKNLIVTMDDVSPSLSDVHSLGTEKILILFAKVTGPDFDSNLLPAPDEVKNRINNSIRNLYLQYSYNKFSLDAEIIPHWYEPFNSPLLIDKLKRILQDEQNATTQYERFDVAHNKIDIIKKLHTNILKMVLLDSEHNVSIKQLLERQIQGRIAFITALDQDIVIPNKDDNTTIGKSKRITFEHTKVTSQGQQRHSLVLNPSLMTIFLPIVNVNQAGSLSSFHTAKYYSREGAFSEFDKIFAHFLGHNLGLGDSYFINCNLDNELKKITGLSGDEVNLTSSVIVQTGSEIRAIFDTLPERLRARVNQFTPLSCPIEKLASDLMGNPSDEFYLNAFFKKKLGWFTDQDGDQMVKIALNPARETSYKLLESTSERRIGLISAYLPFSYPLFEVGLKGDLDDKDDTELFFRQKGVISQDLFLESRKNENSAIQSLHISAPFGNDLLLFPAGEDQKGLNLNESFYDQLHKMKILVSDANAQNLTFKIIPCQTVGDPFIIAPQRTTSVDNITSLNFFESDFIRIQKPVRIDMLLGIENPSSCFDADLAIDQKSVKITQGQTQISQYRFGGEKLNIAPRDNGVVEIVALLSVTNNSFQLSNDSSLEFDVFTNEESHDDPNGSQKRFWQHIALQFHAVPTPDEYKNDLEPFEIALVDTTDSYKYYNPLEIKKGQPIRFQTAVANNGKNPNGNKSSDFTIKWTLQDGRGKNVNLPVSQKHEGIPPQSIVPRSSFIWAIPSNITWGEYKIVLEVDPNNRIEEFNEKNNVIWRKFIITD